MPDDIKGWMVVAGSLLGLVSAILGGWFFIETRIDKKVDVAFQTLQNNARWQLEAHARIINDGNDLIKQLCKSLDIDHDTRCEHKLTLGMVE